MSVSRGLTFWADVYDIALVSVPWLYLITGIIRYHKGQLITLIVSIEYEVCTYTGHTEEN